MTLKSKQINCLLQKTFFAASGLEIVSCHRLIGWFNYDMCVWKNAIKCRWCDFMDLTFLRPILLIIRPATFIMYKNAKFFALFFSWMFNPKSADQLFISLNLFNQLCDIMLINFSVPRIRKPHISNSSPCRANWILTIH